MHLHFRHVGHAQRFVVVEVRLIDAAFGQGDRAVKRGAETEGNAAFDLCSDDVSVDGDSTVDGRDDAFDFYAPAVGETDLGDLCDGGTDPVVHGDATETSGRQRALPVGFVCGQSEHRGL